jgi:hypothetical protein
MAVAFGTTIGVELTAGSKDCGDGGRLSLDELRKDSNHMIVEMQLQRRPNGLGRPLTSEASKQLAQGPIFLSP